MHNVILKKYYFINKFNINNIDKLEKNTIIIYRNYRKKKVTSDIIKLKKYCKIKGIKLYISNNIKLAMKMDVAGAYIPSFNKDFRHLSFKFKKNFKIIGSAHNIKEINIKKKQGCSLIFLSRLFKTHYKNKKSYLGIVRFNLLTRFINISLSPLGGINLNNLNKLRNVNCENLGLSSVIINRLVEIQKKLK